MSAATYSRNPIVNRAISGTTTVNSNSYAVCTYTCGLIPTTDISSSPLVFGANYGQSSCQGQMSQRYFGPGQSIPSSFNTGATIISTGGVVQYVNMTWTLVSGVEFTNG